MESSSELTGAHGKESVAIGLGVQAQGLHSSAFGIGNTASADNSVALGADALGAAPVMPTACSAHRPT